MLTRCPYPDCLIEYEVSTAEDVQNLAICVICPQCGRQANVKSIAILNSLKRKAERSSQILGDAISLDNKSRFIVLLEDIRSLWNVGSIFRTSDAVGVARLYLCGITGCPPRAQITKTALGAEEVVPWQYYIHPLDVIPSLQATGTCIIGLEKNSQSISLTTLLKETKISEPLCLIVGNEIQGLSPETIHYCDYVCHLPMAGSKESLNAAVAFAVAAYFIKEFI